MSLRVVNQVKYPAPAPRGRKSSAIRMALTILLFAAAFCVLQRLTFLLRFPPFQKPTIWTPGSLLFAALLLAPPKQWWVYYVGLCLGAIAAFYGDVTVPVDVAFLAAQFNFAGTAMAAWAIRRFAPLPPFGSLRSLLVFLPTAIVLVPVFTTGPIDLFRFLSGAANVWGVSLRALLSGVLGLLIATPALTLTLVNGRGWLRPRSWWQTMEMAGLMAGSVVVGRVCFDGAAGSTAMPLLLYVPLPLFLWAAIRFEVVGASWVLLLLALQSTWSTVHGRGPFTNESPADNILQLQLFLLATALPVMFLAAVIGERRRDLAGLSQSEERFRLVVESTPNAIVIANAAGKIVLINAPCEKFFGYGREELVGQLVEVLVPERFRPEHPGYRARFFMSPSARPVGAGRELYGRRKDGSEFPVEIGLTPIQTDTDILIVSAIVDITGRKRSEEARQELAHASRLALVGELTACVAHEINQPLGAILSNVDAAELLLEQSPAALEEVRQILGDIRRDDLRASEVIRHLRALLRKREMDLQPVQLNEAISEVLLLVRAESRRRGVAVEAQLAADLPLIRGDKIHLQQVVLNLCFNGLEAMADVDGDKRLTVRTALSEEGRVEGAVSDTGAGISPDRIPRLFEPFFTTKKEGMGLGLSIARSLVEAHGGRIWAENNADRGASFRFALPPDREQQSPQSHSIKHAPARVLG